MCGICCAVSFSVEHFSRDLKEDLLCNLKRRGPNSSKQLSRPNVNYQCLFSGRVLHLRDVLTAQPRKMKEAMYSCGMEKSLVGSRLKPKRMILKSCFIIFALARMNLIFCRSSQKSKVLVLLFIIKHLAILYGLVGTFLVIVACFGILGTWARVSASL